MYVLDVICLLAVPAALLFGLWVENEAATLRPGDLGALDEVEKHTSHRA